MEETFRKQLSKDTDALDEIVMAISNAVLNYIIGASCAQEAMDILACDNKVDLLRDFVQTIPIMSDGNAGLEKKTSGMLQGAKSCGSESGVRKCTNPRSGADAARS